MAEAINVGATAQSLLPSFSANMILYVIITIVVLGLIGWGFYILFKRAKFNTSFVIFQDVGGRITVTDRCKGMQLGLGKTPEKILWVKKYNKYLPLGNIQMGIRTYWYYIDKAGHWHNIGIDFIDVKKREPQLNMQLQMDYARDGINKNLEDRHNKATWFEKWGAMLIGGTIILIMIVFIWLAFRDALQSNQTAQENLKISQELQKDIMDKYAKLLGAMDNVCGGHNIDLNQLINGTGSVT